MYVPGVKHLTADASSRYPSGPSNTTTLSLPDDACEGEPQPHLSDTCEGVHQLGLRDACEGEPPPRLREMLASLRCTDPECANNKVDASIRDCEIGALMQIAVTWENETASDSEIKKTSGNGSTR